MNLQTEISPQLWASVSKPYESGLYKNAVLEAIHHLSDDLRERANVEGDGVALVGQALGGDNPRLRINKFQTETEKSEQKGFEQILRGLYQGVRNPRSHEQWEDSQATADSVILFVQYLLRVIGEAKEPFTLGEWAKRVFDPDFVASTRYAKLLASEIPPKKRMEALITVFRDKMDGDGAKLKFIIGELIDLTRDELDEFVDVVSDELKITQASSEIRMILEILPPNLWSRIEETARLRIENKLIIDMETGKHDEFEDKTTVGWLGTWARDFIKFFTLKQQVRQVVVKKLRGSSADQNYIAEHFMTVLPDLVDSEPLIMHEMQKRQIISAITDALVAPPQPTKLKENLSQACNYPEDWTTEIANRGKYLRESDPEVAQLIDEALSDSSF